METNGKRKHDASPGAHGPSLKKSKVFILLVPLQVALNSRLLSYCSQGGNQGKWMTPSHKAKHEAMKDRSLEVGDMGFWVTCVRRKEMRAADEILSICHEKLFGINVDADGSSDAQETEDIEASIEKELAVIRSAKKANDAPFDLIKMNVDCVLFVRTRPPVDPLRLVREICKDAAASTDKSQWRSRFINKLTPITFTVKATEKGLEELARKVLPDQFQLAEGDTELSDSDETKVCSYAIRPTIRAHQTLKRNEIIDKVAQMISKRHKVDLVNPDKVIVIEIFQMFCGMSVVGKDWEAMKRYNIHELHLSTPKLATNAGEPTEEDGSKTEHTI
ncbi:hypothetical protein F5Y19DRAFT_171524 [Xylariaceae sp. FL1651]|nr:hypothetical protein F5Y19DRAFT_171524 [Xylariaceae sp. FL1651]